MLKLLELGWFELISFSDIFLEFKFLYAILDEPEKFGVGNRSHISRDLEPVLRKLHPSHRIGPPIIRRFRILLVPLLVAPISCVILGLVVAHTARVQPSSGFLHVTLAYGGKRRARFQPK
jgi:hypothetical protein